MAPGSRRHLEPTANNSLWTLIQEDCLDDLLLENLHIFLQVLSIGRQQRTSKGNRVLAILW